MAGIQKIQEQIIEEMSGFSDWMDTYEFLVRLGKKTPSMPEEMKSETNAISGCQSQVWIHAELKNGGLHIAAESDSVITTGIVSLVLRVLAGQPPADIVEEDLYFLDKTGISSALSPIRKAGLEAIIKEIRSRAARLC